MSIVSVFPSQSAGDTVYVTATKPNYVTLKVYNVLGEEIATLVSDRLPAGSYEYSWDATDFTGGIYTYQLQSGDFAQTKKLVVLRQDGHLENAVPRNNPRTGEMKNHRKAAHISVIIVPLLSVFLHKIFDN
ncbi:MAG: T9SS type A sorting domain-containing protein [Calditrichota bacterium]|jgi:hypothetical protein